MAVPEKTTSLVLGSGGARGLAHIGVIQCLEERGYDVRYVAGSSMGALIGGIYAAGKLDIYADWVKALEKSDIVRLLDWSFDGDALFKGERIIEELKNLIGDRNIESLPMGYTAVATDVSPHGSGREVWFNQGPLFDAIRASISIPGIFSPVETDERVLVDGGVVNPVPVGPTLNNYTQLTVAVDLNGLSEIDQAHQLKEPEESESTPLQALYRQSITRYLDKLWPTPSTTGPGPMGISTVLSRSIETMQATITHFRLAATVPSVVISIPRNICGFFDFHRASELIAYGYESAERTLDLQPRGTTVERIASKKAASVDQAD